MYQHEKYEVTDSDSFETCMAKYSCNYHADKINEFKAQEQDAEQRFFDLMDKYKIPTDELIPLMVDFGFAREWGGWHSGKYCEQQGVIEASSKRANTDFIKEPING